VSANSLAKCRDFIVEGNEAFNVAIASISGGVAETNNTTGGTGCQNTAASCASKNGVIIDDDIGGVFNFTDAASSCISTAAAPNASCGDIALAELTPPSGPQNFDFFVNRGAVGTGVTYQYDQVVTLQTVDGTATVANSDYVPRVGANACVVTFGPTTTAPQLCRVQDVPDTNQEADETFTLQITGITNLSNVPGNQVNSFANAQLQQGADFVAQGTILNDDGSRVASINSVAQNEGTPSPDPAGTPTAVPIRFRIDIQGTSAFGTQFTYTTRPAGSTTGVANSQGSPNPLIVPGPSPAGSTDPATELQPSNGVGGTAQVWSTRQSSTRVRTMSLPRLRTWVRPRRRPSAVLQAQILHRRRIRTRV